jgi:hypothetical protein
VVEYRQGEPICCYKHRAWFSTFGGNDIHYRYATSVDMKAFDQALGKLDLNQVNLLVLPYAVER